MRKLLAVVLLFSVCCITKAQNLTAEGTAPDLYVTHTVAPKENFYSIARLYNQAPKSIASFNKITMEKGLTIGQQVKIPLTAQNFDGSGESNGGEPLIPLTHIVAKSETLFKIGTDLNVSAESIRKWNKLSSDDIAPGTPLIVGYLKTNNGQSLVSAVKNNTSPVPNMGEPAKTNADAAETKQIATETKRDDPSVSVNSTSTKKENTSEPKEGDKSGDSINGTPKASPDLSATNAVKDTALAVVSEETTKAGNTTAAPAKEELPKTQETSLSKNEESKTTSQVINRADNSSAAGTFESLYALQAAKKSENTKSGEAATFKSTSGWQDKKYYVLINDITPGTIVKIATSNNNTVYAKVLGSMPEMKENNGLLLRLSNAAASGLGIIDPKFPVQISYYQ